jgi:hypothetical protein
MARGAGKLLIGTMLATLLFAAPAEAGLDTRYAEPAGNGPEPCLESNPCSLTDALAGAPADAVVLLKPGTYTQSAQLILDDDVSLGAEQIDPGGVVIESSALIAVSIAPGSINSLLRDITIDHDPAMAGLTAGLSAGAGVVQRVSVDSGSPSAVACSIAGDEVLIRDTVCESTGGTGAAVNMPLTTSAQAKLVNVTAIASGDSGAGIFLFATDVDADLLLEAENVIARGPLVDVIASASPAGSSATMTLTHSSFATRNAGGNSSITDPATNNNQTQAPLLDADNRQRPGSPTRNAGDNTAVGLGPADIDGQARILEGTVDIGADEFDLPPNTKITKKPPKKTTKRKAKFKFTSNEGGAGFDCKLDKKPYRPCDGGSFTAKRLKTGKHTFRVRAVDGFGNADPSPAKHTWKIKKQS